MSDGNDKKGTGGPRSTLALAAEAFGDIGDDAADLVEGADMTDAEREAFHAELDAQAEEAARREAAAKAELLKNAQADIDDATNSLKSAAEARSDKASLPSNDGADGRSRTDQDGNSKEGKDDPNALKLIGAVEEQSIEEVREEIGKLIGMQTFKAIISDLDEGEDFNELMDLFELNIEYPSEANAENTEGEGKPAKPKKKNSTFYHMVYTGEPGTGKSTAAEKYCQYLRASGIMPEAMFYKISAGDIVSQYVGATANELKKILRMGKEEGRPLILHLDEAYTLTSNKHGEEALAELVGAMTEEADRIVLVLSGYYDPMMEMLDKNEGMRSRIRFEVHCPSYNDEELLDIMKLMLPGQDLERTLTPEAQEAAKKVFSAVREKMQDKFGNGRVAEVLLQDMDLAQKKRISRAYKDLTDEQKLERRDEIVEAMHSYTAADVLNSATVRKLIADQEAAIALEHVIEQVLGPDGLQAANDTPAAPAAAPAPTTPAAKPGGTLPKPA